MSTKDNGGPAFPQSELITGARDWHGDIIPPHVISGGGMTLRDWFAGQALASDPGNNPNLPDDPANPSRWPDAKELAERRAKWAYHQADAMLAERAKQ